VYGQNLQAAVYTLSLPIRSAHWAGKLTQVFASCRNNKNSTTVGCAVFDLWRGFERGEAAMYYI
jgi:hypothetical protein